MVPLAYDPTLRFLSLTSHSDDIFESNQILFQSTAPHDTEHTLPQSTYEESHVYFGRTNETTNHISELRRIHEQVSSLQDSMSLKAELSLIRHCLESHVVSTDDLYDCVTGP
jgi:hypothetical protein